MHRTVLLALLAAVAGVLLPTGRTEALSCVDTETVLVDAERAFVGDLLARDGARLTFRVREVVRGELPGQIVVRDDLAGSGWRFPPPSGPR
jgi:hypothetical protein